jgi:hypothetical protein
MAAHQPILDSEAAAEADTERTLALLGVTRADVLRELQYRAAKKREKMLKRMAAAQRAGGERRIVRDAEGNGGAVEMMIDPVSYHYWGQRLGYQCWEDAQFRREYLRDNDVARVKTIGKCGAVTAAMIRTRRGARRGPVGKRGRWST